MSYIAVNGVMRYGVAVDDGGSAYDFSGKPECIVVPRRLLDRELRRVIEEAMAEGGLVDLLARDCMLALDADVQALEAAAPLDP